MNLRVLILEDRAEDSELVISRLERAGFAVEGRRVDTRADFDAALVSFDPDLILADHGLPGCSDLDALRAAKETRPDRPFIGVTGSGDDRTVVQLVRAGADDVVFKGNLDRLPPAVADALALRASLRLLSPRQLEVLRLIVAGRTTQEVADELNLSLKTAQTHRLALMKRLGVHDVAGLVRYAVKVMLLIPNG